MRERPDVSGGLRGDPMAMLEAVVDQTTRLQAENTALRQQLATLRADNIRLRRENGELRASLDAHITRAGSTASFGPLEMSAGTCVGPRRRRP